MATVRLSLVWRALKTAPMPPSPSFSRSWYSPSWSGGPISDRHRDSTRLPCRRPWASERPAQPGGNGHPRHQLPSVLGAGPARNRLPRLPKSRGLRKSASSQDWPLVSALTATGSLGLGPAPGTGKETPQAHGPAASLAPMSRGRCCREGPPGPCAWLARSTLTGRRRGPWGFRAWPRRDADGRRAGARLPAWSPGPRSELPRRSGRSRAR